MDAEVKLEWLLTNEELNEITNDYMFDWVLEKLNDNGITSEEDSFYKIYYTRFEYSYPDCPKCGSIDKHYVLSKDTWHCKNNNCKHRFSITSGTYLDNTKIEFYKWVRFAYLVGNLNLTNSSAIARNLNITQKTAWNMLETLRTARKETSETKFVNGAEVMAFKHYWQILELLTKRIKKSEVIEQKQLTNDNIPKA